MAVQRTAGVDVLVLGFGNPLRGDDAAGWAAIEQLRNLRASASLRWTQQLTPELAADIASAGRVIFIDAACDNEQGAVACRPVLPTCCGSSAFTHELTPELLLALAERLYGRCPEATLYSVGAASFETGAGLSEPVRAALPALVQQVQQVIIHSEELL